MMEGRYASFLMVVSDSISSGFKGLVQLVLIYVCADEITQGQLCLAVRAPERVSKPIERF